MYITSSINILVIWKQNMVHFPHIIKNVTPTTKKYTTFNLCTMGEMKSSRFPHSTEFRYKKKHAQLGISIEKVLAAFFVFFFQFGN